MESLDCSEKLLYVGGGFLPVPGILDGEKIGEKEKRKGA